ncbi:MAG: hypothetical protein WCX93_08915, partial [Burkholderiaceae bacterium]
MTAASAFLEKWFEKLRNGRRSGVYYFSLWVLPLAIALFTAVAFLGFPSVYPVATGEPLLFRSLPLEAGHTTPLHAAAALQTLPQKPRAELHDGAWLLIELPKQARAQPMAIDFPSRGA